MLLHQRTGMRRGGVTIPVSAFSIYYTRRHRRFRPALHLRTDFVPK